MSIREIDNETLIRRIDPEFFTEKVVAFRFGGGRIVHYENQYPQGEPYWWYPNLPEDEE